MKGASWPPANSGKGAGAVEVGMPAVSRGRCELVAMRISVFSMVGDAERLK